MQILVSDDFTCNSHALNGLSGEVYIPLKIDNLRTGGGWHVSI